MRFYFIQLALNQLWHHRKSFNHYAMMLTLCVSIFFIILFVMFQNGMRHWLNDQIDEEFGAQWIVTSPGPLPQESLEQAKKLGVTISPRVQFFSMGRFRSSFLLMGIDAVQSPYPLVGKLKVQQWPSMKIIETQSPPPIGEIWVEQGVLDNLKCQNECTLQVGDLSLKVSGVLLKSPAPTAFVFLSSPKGIIHHQQLEALNVLLPGSRVAYQWLLTGHLGALLDFKEWVSDQIPQEARWLTPRDNQSQLLKILEQANQFFSVLLVLVVLLAGNGLALGIQYFCLKRIPYLRIYRSFGLSHRQSMRVILTEMALLGVCAMGIASGCAYGVNAALQSVWSNLPFMPQGFLWATGVGSLIGAIMLIGFGGAPLAQLQKISLAQLCQSTQLTLPPARWSPILTVFTLGIMIYLLSWRLPFTLILLICIGIGLGLGLAWLLAFGGLLAVLPLLNRAPTALYMASLSLRQYKWQKVGEILTITLVCLSMFILIYLKGFFLQQWQHTLPEYTPNTFAINLAPDQKDPFNAYLQHHQIHPEAMYPIVRGRLTHINQESLARLKAQGKIPGRQLNRPLNLTWAFEFPLDNRELIGTPWHQVAPGQAKVSVEARFAKRMNIQVGDELRFQIFSNTFNVQVAQLRTVKWESFHPNFFVIFPKGVIDHLPFSYMTSFYVSASQKKALPGLFEQFPSITIFSIDKILEGTQRVLNNVVKSGQFCLFFVGILSILVLSGAWRLSLVQRLKQNALYRVFGMDKRTLRKSLGMEFALLGTFGATFGAVLALGVSVYLNQSFSLPFSWSFMGLLGVSIGIIQAVFMGIAWWGTQTVIEHSPLHILKET